MDISRAALIAIAERPKSLPTQHPPVIKTLKRYATICTAAFISEMPYTVSVAKSRTLLELVEHRWTQGTE